MTCMMVLPTYCVQARTPVRDAPELAGAFACRCRYAFHSLVVFVATLALVAPMAAAQDSPVYAPNVVVVEFAPEVALADKAAASGLQEFDRRAARYGVHLIERAYPFLDPVLPTPKTHGNILALRRTYYVHYSAGEAAEDVADNLATAPGVIYARPVILDSTQAYGRQPVNPDGPRSGGSPEHRLSRVPEASGVVRGHAAAPRTVIAAGHGGDWRQGDLRANVRTNPGEGAGNGIDDVPGVASAGEDETNNLDRSDNLSAQMVLETSGYCRRGRSPYFYEFTEGEECDAKISCRWVDRFVPFSFDVPVVFFFEGVTATAGVDFIPPEQTTTVIRAGELASQPVDFRFVILQDELFEGNEEFVGACRTIGSELPPIYARKLIIDDDRYGLGVDDVAASEAAGEARFTVSLDQANPVQTVRVDYATADGTATAGLDYVAQSGTLVFSPGEVAKTVSVPITDDAEREDNETFTLVLSRARNAEIADREGVGTIIDDDGVFLRIDDAVAEESAGQMVFALRLDRSYPAAVTTLYQTRGASATEGVDYVGVAGSVRFEPGETEQTIVVPLLDDETDEPDETFQVLLSGVQQARYTSSEATGTIVDDDFAPVLDIVQEVRVSEGAGSAVFAVTLSAPSAFEVTAAYATMDGTARAGADYEATAGTLRFVPGMTAGTIRVPLVDDAVREPEETFTLLLGEVRHADLGSGQSTGTIIDDEAVPELRIDDVTVSEDAPGAVFTVRLSGESATEVRVDFATSDETALGGLDYTDTDGTLKFAPGEVEQSIVVAVLEDDLDEPDETFLVQLSEAMEAEIADGTGRGTITDNDEPVTISIYDGDALEDAGVLYLPVRLSRTSSLVTSVLFASSDVTAEAALDYTASKGITVFEPGSTEGVVAVAVVEDALNEEDETFQVTLSRPTNATIARGVATGTIGDNDGVPQLRIDDIVVRGGGEEAIFTVRLSAPSERLVTVAYRTVNGTADAGEDYVAAAGRLEFAPGEVEKGVRVRLLQGERDWREETFTLALALASNAVLEDAVATATIVEEETVEQGVRAAYLARFLRTSASHVVDALGERLRWQQLDATCVPVGRQSLQTLRLGNPSWDPSAGELLDGCSLSAASGAFGVWGRGAFTRVSGRQGALSLSADVTTATLGADYGFPGGIQAGVLLAHSQSAGDFDVFASEGEARSRLTSVYPYASYRLASSRLWALAGAGRGLVEVDGSELLETEVVSSLLAAGTVGRIATGSRVQLGYQGDLFLARAEAEERVQVSRIRAGLEGSMVLGRSLRPYLETALRHDGGDAETGMGLEVGGGLRLRHAGGKLRAELSGRGLLAHASRELGEWGVAAALHYGAPQGIGPTAEIRPVWGPAYSGGMQALWRHAAIEDAARGMPGQRRLEMRLGYGTRLARGTGLARPVLAVTLRRSGRDIRLGYEVATQSGVTVSAAGTAWESTPWRPVSYGLTARAALRW